VQTTPTVTITSIMTPKSTLRTNITTQHEDLTQTSITKKPIPAPTAPNKAALPSNTEPPFAGTIVADAATLLVFEADAPVEVAAFVILSLVVATVGSADDSVLAVTLLGAAELEETAEVTGADEAEDASMEELDPPFPPQLADGAVPSGTMQPPCTVGPDSELEVSAAALRYASRVFPVSGALTAPTMPA